MTFEELKSEADKMGYKLVKKPDWDCACAVPYPNDCYKRNNGHWKCVDCFEYIGLSCQGMTHCRRIKNDSLEES